MTTYLSTSYDSMHVKKKDSVLNLISFLILQRQKKVDFITECEKLMDKWCKQIEKV